MRFAVRYLVLVGLILAAVSVGLLVGPAGLTPGEVLGAVRPEGDAVARRIVLELRLPRISAAMLIGASLAVSGAVFQA
ncbi:MAG: iron chelate uptake ABC transporter family permease subunit, partial [Gemmatimonadota bacterium]